MHSQLIGRHLIESAPRPSRGARPLLASAGTHATLIALSVVLTLRPHLRSDEFPDERVAVVDLSSFAPPTAVQAQARQAEAARLAPRGFQIIVAPPDVPLTLPTIDVTQPTTIPEDFGGRGIAGGLASGIGASLLASTPTSTEPIDGGAADEPPYLLPGQMGPAYPDPLRDDRPDGFVVVRFVIDTLGRVESPSLKVLNASHPLFLDAVRVSLDRLRFLPGRYSGQLVRVRMEQRFEFHLASP
jgi:TonB family protein